MLDSLIETMNQAEVLKTIVGVQDYQFWNGLNVERGFQDGGNFPQSRCYMGLIKVPGIMQHWARIDMWIHPRSHWPYAIMSYTGSAHFNRSLRLFAKRQELSLNPYGLYKRDGVHNVHKGNGEVRDWNVGLVDGARDCKTEEDVFRLLRLRCVAPKDRKSGIPLSAWENVEGFSKSDAPQTDSGTKMDVVAGTDEEAEQQELMVGVEMGAMETDFVAETDDEEII
jgi:hypothetical protein